MNKPASYKNKENVVEIEEEETATRKKDKGKTN